MNMYEKIEGTVTVMCKCEKCEKSHKKGQKVFFFYNFRISKKLNKCGFFHLIELHILMMHSNTLKINFGKGTIESFFFLEFLKFFDFFFIF